MGEDFNIFTGNSLGMRLMQTLSEQLDGTFNIENNFGTLVKVCFKQQIFETGVKG